jgi:hypothetical protein
MDPPKGRVRLVMKEVLHDEPSRASMENWCMLGNNYSEPAKKKIQSFQFGNHSTGACM